MSHVRKMALVDPRLLETLRTPTQTPVNTTLRDLDAEMTSILDKSDVGVSEKVRLYNQALLRYNNMAKDRAAKPTPIVVVKGNEPIVATDVMADVVTMLPKTLQEKGSQLVSRLKTTKWNDRGELLHEGVAIPDSNVVDLVHDLLWKRRTSDPIGWQQFASQMHAANIPMELVDNVARRQHIQKRTRIPTPTPKPKKRRGVDRYNCPTIGNLIKTTASSRDRHNMARPCIGVVIIIAIVCLVYFLTILLSTSPRSYNWCPGSVVPWDDRNYSKYTTTLNVSEVTVVLPH